MGSVCVFARSFELVRLRQSCTATSRDEIVDLVSGFGRQVDRRSSRAGQRSRSIGCWKHP